MDLLTIALEILVGVLTVGITYGVVRTQIDGLKDNVKRLEEESANMKESFVTYQVFNEVIKSMREDHSELKADVKEVIRLLSASKRSR